MSSAVEIATQTPQLSTLVKFLKAANLVSTVAGLSNATIFAPTNQAFAELPQSSVDALKRNPEALKKVLLTHVVPVEAPSYSLEDGQTVRAVSGTHLTIHLYHGSVFVSTDKTSATVVKPDIFASRNVVIHIINRVLLP